MLVEFPRLVKAANLLGGAGERDDDWNNGDLECLQCGDEGETNQMQQTSALFKKNPGSSFKNNGRSATSRSSESRCFNCGGPGHHIPDCPKPEVPKSERP